MDAQQTPQPTAPQAAEALQNNLAEHTYGLIEALAAEGPLTRQERINEVAWRSRYAVPGRNHLEQTTVERELDTMVLMRQLAEAFTENVALAAYLARDSGATWAEIGAAAGISTSTAKKRYGP
ncbi:hypothetical protein [Sinomonas sp. G460-2]|uniref:hypothetical protein n=1 Tax=Sinomonas sp. G460-2 TaxID=3393464 RepID=UPI0039F0EF7C